MTFKVNSLNPFDKAFFGKPMSAWANRNSGEMLKPSKFTMDSIDDFNKHFAAKMKDFGKLEKSPEIDTIELSNDGTLVSDIF